MFAFRKLTLVVFTAVALAATPSITLADQRESAAKLLARTMFNPEFRPKTFRGGEWFGDGDSYLALEPSATAGGTDIVRYQTASGAREIFVPASRLIPAGDKKPLSIECYSFSPDGKPLLLFTNCTTVWHQNPRGDYWLFNPASGALRKIGGDAPASSLMFAKFSPDGSKAAYVRGNNVYSEDLASKKITQLTRDGSDTVINGTSDWVNEEEFDIRDGFQWSPDGQRIAFLQFNTTAVRTYTLIYDLGEPRGEPVSGISYPGDLPYPTTLRYPYPLTGTPNSTVRVGTVKASGGKVTWIETSGDPANFYIPRMGWTDAGHLLLEHMNRLQNRNEFLLCDAASGASHQILVEEDRTWVDLNEEVLCINHHQEFLLLSERDGWRHLYRASLKTGKATLVTRGNFDVVSLERLTPDEKWIYFIASPDNATQRYLYRAPLDASADPERLTPAQPDTHSYTISPNGEYAFHDYSSFNSPPASDVVHLPDHRLLRSTADNSALAERVKPLSGGLAEFLQLDAGNGLTVDAWLLKPPAFDATKKYP